MPTGTFRGVIHDGVVVLENGRPIGEGTEVVVTPIPGACGSSAAILAALDQSPNVPSAWVDELEQLIAEGCRPSGKLDLFSEEPEYA